MSQLTLDEQVADMAIIEKSKPALTPEPVMREKWRNRTPLSEEEKHARAKKRIPLPTRD